MTASVNRVVQPTPEALAQQLAKDVAAALIAAINERGKATLVVSGGSTPLPMFTCLAKDDAVDWSAVTITLADERAVPVGHADSNESFVHTHLLRDAAAAARFVSLLPADLSAVDQLDEVSQRVGEMGEEFDVVLLGMGTDGHTASLFPDAPELKAAMEMEDAVTALHPPSVSQARISMSAKRLLATRHLWLHISGERKSQVLDEALAGGVLPIAVMLTRASELNVATAIYANA